MRYFNQEPKKGATNFLIQLAAAEEQREAMRRQIEEDYLEGYWIHDMYIVNQNKKEEPCLEENPLK